MDEKRWTFFFFFSGFLQTTGLKNNMSDSITNTVNHRELQEAEVGYIKQSSLKKEANSVSVERVQDY